MDGRHHDDGQEHDHAHGHGCHDHAKGDGGHEHGDHDHDHDHGGHGHHGHSHGLGHHHSTISNLKLALALNLTFSVIEIFGGFWTGSVAILSDAVHDLSDALAIALAYLMERLGDRSSNERFSYGYRRLSLLSALVTCGVLIVASGLVLAQAIPRLLHPETPKLGGMVGFAVVGIVVNGYGAFRLARGGTLNERVVSWHLIEDVLGWVSVLIGALVMMIFDLPIIDPILSILLSLFILWGVLRNLRKTLSLFLQATPEGIDLAALRREIEALGGVLGTHDAHLWSLDGQSHVLTLHVVMAEDAKGAEMDTIRRRIRSLVEAKGKIHVTVEMETSGQPCPAFDCVKST